MISLNAEDYWLTRIVLQRGLALIFLIAFLNAVNQFKPLLGERGLLPVPQFVARVPFRDSPSLLFFLPKDFAFTLAAWLGVALSAIALLGVADRYSLWLSMSIWAALWVLYISFVNVGQTFYAFGWESILLEACVYAVFLGNASTSPQAVVIWMFRWLVFRVMFGAGLIKLRGDSCWRDLTCLDYYYETQPMPNPLSWYFHWGPEWTHKGGVLVNHLVELIVPFALFLPQPIASIAGILTILFQLSIFISGNLSWLNVLTAVIAISAIDDRRLSAFLAIRAPETHTPALTFRIVTFALTALVVVLSIKPIRNLLSPRQVMNTIYNQFHFIGTYGAFGSITRPRYEVVVEGTDDTVLTQSTKWREYEFKGKPGDPSRLPPQIAPYHLRLDWLMWFAALSSYQSHPWFVHFIAKLLEEDRDTLSLLRTNPFPNKPPNFVRARLAEYHFSSPAERARTGRWWTRDFAATYFPPVSLRMQDFKEMLESQGWLEREYSH